MKRLIRIFVIALVSIAMMVPPIEAQSRTTGNRNERSHSTQNSRPNNSGRPSNSSGRPGNNNNGHRPGNNGGNNGHRPGNNNPGRPGNNNNGHRPGNNGGSNGHRPGNNNPGRPGNNNNGHRPGNNGHNPGRPGHGGYNPGRPHRPGGDYRPHRPNRPHRPTVIVPPHRPHRPPMRPWSRPVPPPSWRPRPAAPVIASILGITFGTAINMSLDYLINRGYTIDGYGNDAVYLRDVNEMSYYWPDATLYYGAGGLARSEFLYSTSYPDPMRYNSLYTRFNRTYGPPINIVRTGGVLSATWFAPNRGYVTIDYRSQYSLGGDLRYFTTLTFGL
ncbi:hypothetical protein [uncultured Muribaculum sp.]|mgnify:FL=1|uniref:hypothetical protein n=1 Tax=uncultured Muribaculum sp. TaxID=1918613 RepID=UPI00259CF42E|nr:hypothetical protein [uncultured Muribaculum sp.]